MLFFSETNCIPSEWIPKFKKENIQNKVKIENGSRVLDEGEYSKHWVDFCQIEKFMILVYTPFFNSSTNWVATFVTRIRQNTSKPNILYKDFKLYVIYGYNK